MIHDPILPAIWRRCETGMAHTIHLLFRVLLKHAAGSIFGPRGGVHGIPATDQFEAAETVVAVIAARGRVDDELLVGGRVGELLRAFVG